MLRFLTAALLLASCAPPPPPAPLESASAPEKAPAHEAATEYGFVGVVLSGEATDIEPRVEGRIEAVLVKEGDSVSRGDPLVRLDVQASRYDLAMARAALAEATRRYARRSRLVRSGVVTREEMDQARRELLQERARTAKLHKALADSTVVAPFAGSIGERYLTPGALAGPGRPLVRLVGHCVPTVRFAIPEERAHDLPVGASVAVRVAPSGALVRGRVTGVSPEVDASSRTVFAVASLARGRSPLTTGLLARVFPAAE